MKCRVRQGKMKAGVNLGFCHIILWENVEKILHY